MTQTELMMVESFFRKRYPYQTKGSIGFCVNAVEALRRSAKVSVAQWVVRAYVSLHAMKTPFNKEKFVLKVNQTFLSGKNVVL